MDDLFTGKPLRVLVYGRNLDDLLPLLKQFPVELVQDKPDLVISHGGDGSLLGAERLYPGIPKCPIRDRKQNPKCPFHSELDTLKSLFSGELDQSCLEKVQAYIDDTLVLEGLNDLVLSRELVSSAIRYRIWVDDKLLRSQVVSDSLVIATPFGSTGYFQSITHGNFRTGVGLAFNNAMDGSNFTVLPSMAKIKVQILRGPVLLVADNNPEMILLREGDSIQAGLSKPTTVVYGIDVFRCLECYQLRRNGT